MTFWEIIENLYAQIADAPPPTPGREYRIVDVPGPDSLYRLRARSSGLPRSLTFAVAGDSDFADYIERIPLGPVLVTLRSKPIGMNQTNQYPVAAYVNGRQVGWMSTDWTAGLTGQIIFVLRLDDAGILPRFRGIHRLTGDTGRHIINFGVPRSDQLYEIERRVTG